MSEDTRERNKRIRLERVRTFFDNTRGNPVFAIASGLVFVLLLGNEGGGGAALWLWLALLVLMCSLAFSFEWHVRRSGLSFANARRFFIIRATLGVVVMALLGAGVLLLPESPSHSTYALTFILAISVVSASNLSCSTVFPYSALSNLFVMVPYVVSGISFYRKQEDDYFLYMSVSGVVWLCVFLLLAFRISRKVVRGIELQERLRDEIAEREHTECELRASQEEAQRLATMLRLICDNVPDMIWAKDVENRYIFANKALCEKLLNATDTEEPVSKTFDFFVRRERERHPDDPGWHTFGQFTEDVDRHTIGREESTAFEESGKALGQFAYLEIRQVRFVDAQGQIIGTVGCARDITARKASESLIEHLAHHDTLTELPNRILMNNRLNQALALTRRDRVKLALLFIDLDKMKPVNDTLGHDVGDMLLKEAAKRMREMITRESDTLARLGGDEFIVTLPRVGTEQDAAVVASRILKVLSKPFFINTKEVRVSASIGIAFSPSHGEDAARLLKNADAAMYVAKNAGGNAFRFYDPSMTTWLE